MWCVWSPSFLRSQLVSLFSFLPRVLSLLHYADVYSILHGDYDNIHLSFTLFNCLHSLHVLMWLTLQFTHLGKIIFLVACFTHLANWRTFLWFMFKATSVALQLVFLKSSCAGFSSVIFWSDCSYSVHFHFLRQCLNLSSGDFACTESINSFFKCQISFS